jgi:glycosyltransferase involved in cell wall biosynthesis
MRERLARMHPNVLRLPAAAVDLGAFAAPPPAADAPPVAIYAGHADFRFDADLVAEVASLLENWSFVIAGPTAAAVRRRLDRLPNVHLTGPHPASTVPRLLAEARVCLLPYRLDEFTDSLFPVKLVEYLAAGRPVVGVPIAALGEFEGIVATAAEPGEFAAAIIDSAARDSPEAQSRRQESVRPFDWNRRIGEMEDAIQAALNHG